MDKITKQKIEKYLEITSKAIEKVRTAKEKKINWQEKADDFLDMAKRYYADAKYYFEKNDFVTAFAAVNYAHGWLDAGTRLGLFDVGKDSKLFTVD